MEKTKKRNNIHTNTNELSAGLSLVKKGLKVVLHPSSKIIHYEGKGSGSRRSYKVQKFHIVDFHKGAYRAYRDHHELELLWCRLR